MALSVSLMRQPQSTEAVGWQQYHPAQNDVEGQVRTAESSNKHASGRQLMHIRGRGRFTQLQSWSSSESRQELEWGHRTGTAEQLASHPKEAPQPASTDYISQQASASLTATATSELQSESEDERSSCSWWPDQALVYRTGGWSLVNESALSPAHKAPSTTLELCPASPDDYQYDHSQVSQQPSDKHLPDTGHWYGWPGVEAARQATQPQRSAQPEKSQAEAHHAPWGAPTVLQVQADSWIADLHAQPQPSSPKDWMNACQPRRDSKVHNCLKAVCPREGRQPERGDWMAAFSQELEQEHFEQKAAGMHAPARHGWSALSSAIELEYHEASRLGMMLEEPVALKAAEAASPGSWSMLLHERSPWIR